MFDESLCDGDDTQRYSGLLFLPFILSLGCIHFIRGLSESKFPGTVRYLFLLLTFTAIQTLKFEFQPLSERALSKKAAFRVRQCKVNVQPHEQELSYMTCITINGGHAGKFLYTTLNIYS